MSGTPSWFSLTPIADEIMERHPGYPVEIIGGHLLVTPLPDAPHARVLTDVMVLLINGELHRDETLVAQKIAIRLPTGPEDYAVPDLVVVNADIEDHHVENNTYDPVCFRLVLEVTSGNWKDDLKTKVGAYARAKVPVYVVVDRKHQRLHVLTEPAEGTYGTHRVHSPGETVDLPDSIGAKVTLDVAAIIEAGRPRR
ncbi:Uma2 family endonuclease [Streptomyces griseoluteus]|uniref:Uma2 family endonuclease n=1 Tax=Streptomyces griseoluteus TaxID=29306 RepID=A0A4Z1DP12_STRGP|nr:Uma2 family endonuclease [Streptomyces griseoluteus]TGN87146.1 Uma2 family endonuclease [Streptomyces griseoluteus]GHF15235.1 membrane protein [Streptomyces griseoluteus]